LTSPPSLPQDILAEFHMMQSNSAPPRKRTQSDDTTTLEALKGESGDVIEAQKKIEASVLTQTSHLAQRVDQILERVTKLKGRMPPS
jgi:hypothetical protein